MKKLFIGALIVSCFHVNAAERQSVFDRIHTNPVIVQPLYQMIKDTDEALTHFGVNHWAFFGTLLGAVRHEGLIKHDDDADFGVDKADEEKLKNPQLVEMFSKLGYDIFSDETHDTSIVGYKVYKKDMVSLGDKEVPVFLDLFLFQQEEGRYVLSRPGGRAFFKNPWFSLEQIETKQPYKFGPITLIGPSDACSFLTRFYGPEWNELALYYFSHTQGEPPIKYKWSMSFPGDRDSSLPREPLEERVTELLSLESQEGTTPPPES